MSKFSKEVMSWGKQKYRTLIIRKKSKLLYTGSMASRRLLPRLPKYTYILVAIGFASYYIFSIFEEENSLHTSISGSELDGNGSREFEMITAEKLDQVKKCLSTVYPIKLRPPHVGDQRGGQAAPDHCWRGLPLGDFYRPKFLPSSVSAPERDNVFTCCDEMLLDTDADFLTTQEELPTIPGIKNPCYCAGTEASRLRQGRGLVR